ncbi:MAG: OmpA family protein [Sphingomicrobium sp.]
MRVALLSFVAFVASAAGVSQAPPGQIVPIELLRADLIARSGGTTIYFGSGSAVIGAPARPMIAAQAQWLLLHPEVSMRIEGHGDPSDTRDHALAIGARRAAALREYYLLLGVPPGQVSIMSWGAERPGPPRADLKLLVS